jgi:hypothetical protein
MQCFSVKLAVHTVTVLFTVSNVQRAVLLLAGGPRVPEKVLVREVVFVFS